VHQLVAAPGLDALDALDAALGELRAAGWPAPEHPDSGEDADPGDHHPEAADGDAGTGEMSAICPS
jgi:hypothetical protein